MNGVIHDIMRVNGVLEVACDLLHGQASSLLVLPEIHVDLVREGKAEKESSEEHLDGDQEVLVSGRRDGAEKLKPLQDGEEKTCTQWRTLSYLTCIYKSQLPNYSELHIEYY